MSDMFENLSRDLQRYCQQYGYRNKPTFWQCIMVICKSPGFWAITHHRFGFWVNNFFSPGYKNPVKFLLKFLYFITKPVMVWFAKTELLVTADIGPGLFLSNKGNIMLGVKYMGENCTIEHNVTIGQGPDGETPNFGKNIRVGHDSIIYGNIRLGDNIIIENGTVISKSLPGNMIVGGNPCRILKRNIERNKFQDLLENQQ